MLEPVLRPEAAEAVLRLARGVGQDDCQTAVDEISDHWTTELVARSEGLTPRAMREAMGRFARGEPTRQPRLSLDHIRAEADALERYVKTLSADQSWFRAAAEAGLRRVPWRDELDASIEIYFIALGGSYTDGEALMAGPTARVVLDLYHLRDPHDLRVVTAHELNHAAVYLYRWRHPERAPAADDPVSVLLDLLYLEGLARFSTLGRRYREDIGNCFDAVQEVIDRTRAGEDTAAARDELFTGGDGQGHLGGTAGAFIFETLFGGTPSTDREMALREGPAAVLRLYDSVAARRGLPRLDWR